VSTAAEKGGVKVLFRWEVVVLAFLLTTGCSRHENHLAALSGSVHEELAPSTPVVGIYAVNKRVCDFPDFKPEAAFATPEAAYVTLRRFAATGNADWRPVSVKRVAQRMSAPTIDKVKVTPAGARGWLTALILEVRIFHGQCADYAAVIARIDGGSIIDMLYLELENGRWLNAGNDVLSSVADARTRFAAACRVWESRPHRPPVENPQAYLKPYVEFLNAAAQSPEKYLLDCLQKHPLVILGEIHHRPAYWAVVSRIVRNPRFAKAVGVIYLELPANHQKSLDEWLDGETPSMRPIMSLLRDMLWMGWPDQAMFDFFLTVRDVNHRLPPEQRVRILLVDMERPWEEIHTRNDWRGYDTDRDALMARNILKDARIHKADQRHGLFIVGYTHALINMVSVATDQPYHSAGWHLRQALSDDVFAIIEHGPIISNMGQVFGRRALGLFDSAFAATGDKPAGFLLARSPFGLQPFDADADLCRGTSSLYSDAFQGYLYVEPLDRERFSALIPGFYTDECIKEIDRRYRIMFGTGMVNGLGLSACTGERFTQWMSLTWGQPRDWIGHLGPVDAWHDGDAWQDLLCKRQYQEALEHPEAISALAKSIFRSFQMADYGAKRPLRGVPYQPDRSPDKWLQWVRNRFGQHPIESVRLGPVTLDSRGRPSIAYLLLLNDGSQLEGILPFEYNPLSQSWMATEGLDWHLFPATREANVPDGNTREKKAKSP
jgi:hypothetical protein